MRYPVLSFFLLTLCHLCSAYHGPIDHPPARIGSERNRRSAISQSLNRRDILGLIATFTFALKPPQGALAESYQTGIRFEGGAGGLGKTAAASGYNRSGLDSSDSSGTFVDEVTPDIGELALVSFEFPKTWILNKSHATIDARDFSSGDAAYVLCASLGGKAAESVPAQAISSIVFSKTGKYGAYGEAEDVKVISDRVSGATRTLEYSFTALTPALRTVPKRAIVTVQAAGGAVYVLVASTSQLRYKKVEGALRAVGRSFRVAVAPQKRRVAAKVEFLNFTLTVKER
ncbi:unnamed protein product [Chrysoparadoxa australica]